VPDHALQSVICDIFHGAIGYLIANQTFDLVRAMKEVLAANLKSTSIVHLMDAGEPADPDAAMHP